MGHMGQIVGHRWGFVLEPEDCFSQVGWETERLFQSWNEPCLGSFILSVPNDGVVFNLDIPRMVDVSRVLMLMMM